MNAIIGWGSTPYLSEHDSDGNIIWAARYGLDGDSSSTSYRALRYNWTGRPTDLPSVTISPGSDANTTIYVHWNGATEVRTWQLFGSCAATPQDAQSLQNTTWLDFETAIVWQGTSDYAYFQVAAMDADRQVLSYSNFTAADGSGEQLAVADNQTVTAGDPDGNTNTYTSVQIGTTTALTAVTAVLAGLALGLCMS